MSRSAHLSASRARRPTPPRSSPPRSSPTRALPSGALPSGALPSGALPSTHNRCCFISPDNKSFGQIANLSPLEEGRTFINVDESTVCTSQGWSTQSPVRLDAAAQCVAPAAAVYVETSDGALWHNIDNTDDIDKYFMHGVNKEVAKEHLPLDVVISEVPRVKVIAQKFRKYKSNNLQLRRCEEKVVCVEYDVFEGGARAERPSQLLRAFFTIRPEGDQGDLTHVPKQYINKFQANDPSEKEVEIIDAKITENQPYLDDIGKILHRKQTCLNRKGNNTLDLHSLYEIAVKECVHYDRRGTSTLTSNELTEIKKLILKKCDSSANGIRRKTLQNNNDNLSSDSIISASIINELLRKDSPKV